MPKDFKTKIKLNALPEDVYAALTNPFAIELWSGEPATMSTTPETEFELWGGDIAGQNIEFVENHKIVQEWYFGQQEPKSIVTMKIFPNGAKKSSLEIVHTNIPDEDFDDLTAGWTDCYIAPLKIFLEEGDE